MIQATSFTWRFMLRGLAASAGLAIALAAFADDQAWDPRSATEEDFIVLRNGDYSDRAGPYIHQYFDLAETYDSQVPFDVKALVAGKLTKEDVVGFVAKVEVDEDMVRYVNGKYDPDNRVLNDSDYARSLGYDDIYAYISMFGNDDTILLSQPAKSRDRHLTTDLNHNFTYFKPIYPGDTLYVVLDEAEVFDLTSLEGSTRRWMAVESHASIYNQDAEKVQEVVFRTTRGLRLWADESHVVEAPTMADVWDAPDWKSRPAHFYTDEDWQTIKGIWANEKRQGATPLYWEDVKIGDEPTWTADGPVYMSVQPEKPWGAGISGSKTLRHEIMNPEDYDVTLVREENTGNYTTANRDKHVLPTPGVTKRPPMAAQPDPKAEDIQSSELHKEVKESRSILINYMGRDFAIRHVNNWMGDHGWLRNIRWSIMSPKAFERFEGYDNIPQFQRSSRYLSLVPSMQGKSVNIHGLTQDLAIVKSYVYDKYVVNGEHVVELAWWIENIEGDIWEEGAATVVLPTRM